MEPVEISLFILVQLTKALLFVIFNTLAFFTLGLFSGNWKTVKTEVRHGLQLTVLVYSATHLVFDAWQDLSPHDGFLPVILTASASCGIGSALAGPAFAEQLEIPRIFGFLLAIMTYFFVIMARFFWVPLFLR
jgi:hypothetical protein